MICITLLSTLTLFQYIYGSEIDHGILIVDRKPWKISWVENKDNDWVLLANFDKLEIRTFFKHPPPETGFGLSHKNKPYKQEISFYLGKKFSSTDCQYEQWPDGAKAVSFIYKNKLEREGEVLELTNTAVIEEVNGAKNEIRYTLYKI